MHSKQFFKSNSISARFTVSLILIFTLVVTPIKTFADRNKKSHQDIETKIFSLKKKIISENTFKKKLSFLIKFKKDLAGAIKANQDPSIDVYLNLLLQALDLIPHKNVFNKSNCQKFEKLIYSKVDPKPETIVTNTDDADLEEVLVTPQTEAANDAIGVLALFCNQ